MEKLDEMETEESPATSPSCVTKKTNAWSQKILDLIKVVDCFNNKGSSKKEYVPFIINDIQIGLVPPDVLQRLEFYRDIFYVVRDLLSKDVKYVTMATNLNDKTTRTQQFACVMRDWKDRDLFPSLKQWSNEQYAIKDRYGGDTILEVERSACSLFGFRTYGVHLNGYVKNDSGDVYMWIARRSKDKATYPGKLDNTVAGGIASEEGVLNTVMKECKSQAGMSEKLALIARPAGTLSYFHEDEFGLQPKTQFVFDLELPRSFEPTNTNGDVSDFYLLPIKEVKELIATKEFKPNSALVLLDFFIRHGSIDPDTESHYIEFSQGCRRSLPY